MLKNITWKHIVVGLIVVLIIAANGFVSWASKALPATDVAIQALQSDSQVKVTENSGLYVFEPLAEKAETGFVFYPGGRVDYRAYAAVLHKIAAQGYFVALVPMPLNLAYFNANAADQVIALYPDIKIWAIGGHSLGGVFAGAYASKHNNVQALIFWASYPADDSLKDSDIKILSIYGTKDMAGMDKFKETSALLPSRTQYVVIEGGNHAQFGDYGEQSGDYVATISRDEQQSQAVNATVEFLKGLEE